MPKRSSSPSPATEFVEAGAAREHRGTRRKRETRVRLLRAAFALIAERGADGVAINEITDAADVGFGSFYSHFKSKEEVHATVLQVAFNDFGMALDELTVGVDDPAETIAICARHSLALARKQPRWGRLLLREWYRPEAFRLGLGTRLLRNISAGIAAKRFNVDDPLMTLVTAGGTIVSAIALQLALSGGGAELLTEFGLNAGDLDERTAAIVLRGLGVEATEVQRITEKPLPTLDWAPLFAHSL